jgi:hypothetical protein
MLVPEFHTEPQQDGRKRKTMERRDGGKLLLQLVDICWQVMELSLSLMQVTSAPLHSRRDGIVFVVTHLGTQPADYRTCQTTRNWCVLRTRLFHPGRLLIQFLCRRAHNKVYTVFRRTSAGSLVQVSSRLACAGDSLHNGHLDKSSSSSSLLIQLRGTRERMPGGSSPAPRLLTRRSSFLDDLADAAAQHQYDAKDHPIAKVDH